MKNKALNKTNVKLTGNIKLVITDRKWYFESIDSSRLLETSTYKGYEYNKNLGYHTNLRNFINNSNKSNLYDVVGTQSLRQSNELYNQYHDLYNFGCYSEESQMIDENMRFFAPINIVDKSDLPELFVIMKTEFTDNTLQERINTGKVVEVFDLSNVSKSVFNSIKDCHVTTDYKNNLNVTGFDINNGQYNTYTNNDVSDFIDNESTITEFDNWVTNSFSRNNLIYTNIVNLEFAFTDKEVDGKFMKYFGFYCSKNEIDFEDAIVYENTLRLIKTEHEYIKFTPNYKLKEYVTKELSAIGNSFGRYGVGVVEFDFKINPQVGSMIQIISNDLVDYNLVLNSELVSGSVLEVKNKIVDEINNNYLGNVTSVSARLLSDNSIRLQTNNVIDDLDNIKLSCTSNTIKIINPIIGKESELYQGEFTYPADTSILTNQYFSNLHFDHLMYIKGGKEIYSEIDKTYKYLGQYLYKLKDSIKDIKSGSMFWFSKNNIDQPYILSITDFGELDMNTEVSKYNNLNDFNLLEYKQYLISVINSPDYVGNILEYFSEVSLDDITDEQKQEYKSEVLNIINLYFDDIQNNDDYLIKDINSVDYSYTTVKNEYDRLVENRLPSLRAYNRLYQFITKWSSGLDSNNNPNRLNIALPFGEESFNASHYANRLKSSNTHDYFIIIDGVPEYFTSTNNTSLSYSKIPLELEDFESEEENAYEWLQHQNDTNKLSNISTIKYDALQKTSSVYFKGVKYNIAKDLDGYTFSVVMKTSTQVIDDVFTIQYVQNDVFKTFTLFIEFYIPDPVLTTLERDQIHYFIDKSLFYYSNKLYATIESLVDFGQDDISLDLYNANENKVYLGATVTRNWYHTLPGGDDIIYVGRGNSGVFNTNFSNIISIGDNLSINYRNLYSDDDPQSPWYGMVITFEDIVEVTDNHFWCKEIKISSNLLGMPAEDWEIDDELVDEFVTYNVLEEFKANNNIFNENNTIYISKAIAYERAKYDKIINRRANEARYYEISLSSIKNYLKLNDIKSGNKHITINVYNQLVSDMNISNKSTDAGVTPLTQPYRFKFGRQHLKFKPQINALQSFYGNDTFENIFCFDEPNYQDFVKIISKVSQEYLDLEKSKLIDIPPLHSDSEVYDYIRTANNEIVTIKLPWLVAPNEIRNYKESIVMNTNEKLSFTITINDTKDVNLVVLFKNYITNLCLTNQLTDSTLISFMSIYDSVDQNTLNNFDVKDYILSRFVSHLFTKIYRVEEVKTSTGTLVHNYINNTNLVLDTEYTGTLTIKLTR